MKNKTDISKGLDTSNTSKEKTKVGKALSSIWGGIKNVFTGKGAVQAKQDGTGVVLKDDKGNVLVDKPVNNTNWQSILAGVGLLVGGITGATSGQPTTQEQYEIENQQQIRTGSNTLLIVGLGVVGIGLAIWAMIKIKK